MPPSTKEKITMVSSDGMIITSNGKWFNVLNPDPKDVDIEDIAHALSNQCRFTGHTTSFYSVAQHSVLVSECCNPSDAKWGLLHDASEAYLSDIARPVKKHPDFGPFYLKAEAALTEAVMRHFDLPPAMPDSVRAADDMLLRTEARDLMAPTFPVYPGETLGLEILPWNPDEAYYKFMERYEELFK
jgi:hypothetical protein